MKPIKPSKSKSPPQKEPLPSINSKKEKSFKESPIQSPKGSGKNQLKTINQTSQVKEETLISQSENEKQKKDLKKIQENYKKRLQLEKEQEKKDRELFEKILSEAKTNNFKSHSVRTTLENQAPPIKITEKKAQAILENGGMLDAYKYVISCLCKNGLPTGNLFEYAAFIVQGYEKKWKEKKSKMTKIKLEKYWNNKEIEVLGKLNEDCERSKLNRSLEERNMNKYIRTLDRSRSSNRIKEPRSLSRTRDLEKLSTVKNSQKVINIDEKNNEKLNTSGNKSPKEKVATKKRKDPPTSKKTQEQPVKSSKTKNKQ